MKLLNQKTGRLTALSKKREILEKPVLIYIMDTITELFYYESNCRLDLKRNVEVFSMQTS